jgi:phage shock protein A
MENVENIILEHLRAIRTDIGTVKDDVRELKNRVGNLEAGQATILQHLGHQASVTAQQHASFDRIVERVERIEKRLELQ